MNDNLINKKYGKLTILQEADKDIYGHKMVLCRCDCGKEIITIYSAVLNGRAKSCGCLRKETKYGGNRQKHPRIYKIWHSMRDRCERQKNTAFQHYGGRGISVCDEWSRKPDGFENFCNWAINNGYSDDLTIDRIDVNKGYFPDNCRWVSYRTQANNKTNTIRVEYNGVVKPLSEWVETLNMEYSLVVSRLKAGWSVKEAFEKEPDREKHKIHYLSLNGETHSISEWSRITGLSRSCINYRLKKGMEVKDVLNN